MQNLLIETGNTAIKAALSEGMTLGKTFRYQGEKKTEFIISLIEKEKPSTVVLASVYDIPAADEKRRPPSPRPIAYGGPGALRYTGVPYLRPRRCHHRDTVSLQGQALHADGFRYDTDSRFHRRGRHLPGRKHLPRMPDALQGGQPLFQGPSIGECPGQSPFDGHVHTVFYRSGSHFGHNV